MRVPGVMMTVKSGSAQWRAHAGVGFRVLAMAGLLGLLPLLGGVQQRAAGSTICPSNGIMVPVSLSTTQVQAMVDSPGPDRVFCWAPGVHRVRRTLVMHPGDTFVGIPDPMTGAQPVLDGSVVRKHWARLSKWRWVTSVASLTTPSIFLPPGGRCLDGTNHCAYPDDVFFGEKRLRRVWSLRAQGRGSYFVDYGAHRLYVGRDPAAAGISQAVPLPLGTWPQPMISAMSGGATIQGLTIEKCGVALQGAAIRGYRVTISDVVVRSCHGWGLDVDDLSTVTNTELTANGQGGIVVNSHLAGATGPTGVIADDLVDRNGWIRCWGICAGIKSSATNGVAITNSTITNNYGSGVWIDNDSINYTIQDNDLVGNRTAGVMLEVSYDGLVQGNTILGSGIRPVEPIKVGAIHVLASGSCSATCPPRPTAGIVIRDNIVGSIADPNAYGIVLRAQSRGVGLFGPHQVRDVLVSGNAVTLCGTETKTTASTFNGADSGGGDNSIYTSGNTFTDNHYTMPDGLPAFRWQTASGSADGWLTFSQWQQAGMDPADTPTATTC
jgi:hypothetical protein